MNLFRTLVLGVTLVGMAGSMAQAKISKSQFNSSETMTSGKLFMNQVDTVSLYLSTDHIVYAPRLTNDMHVRIALTLLGLSFNNDQKAVEDFVGRHVATFNKTLIERLEYFTPQIAKDFNPDNDIEFVIQVGDDQKPVGVWKAGKWTWGETKPEEVQQLLDTEGKTASKKKCPALVKTKTEETPAPAVVETPK